MSLFKWSLNGKPDSKYEESHKLEYGFYAAYVDYDLSANGWFSTLKKKVKEILFDQVITYYDEDTYVAYVYFNSNDFGHGMIEMWRREGFKTAAEAKKAVENKIKEYSKAIVAAGR